MGRERLGSGVWLNGFLWDMLRDQDGIERAEEQAGNGVAGQEDYGPLLPTGANGNTSATATSEDPNDATKGSRFSVSQPSQMVEAAQKTPDTHKPLLARDGTGSLDGMKGKVRENGVGSRELSGEMGGDTET